MNHITYLSWITVLSLLLNTPSQADCDNIKQSVFQDERCTRIKTYHSEQKTDAPILLIALHGDAPFHKPSYQYDFARIVAEQSQNLVAVGLLRPGYSDTDGRRSDGNMGDAIGDNYDATRVNQIASAIKKLQQHYKPAKTILAGHSGGGAITANLIALFPNMIDHAVIVSCPCDVSAWRKDMFALTGKRIFDRDIKALSPITLINTISTKTQVTLIHGNNDAVAKPHLSKSYLSALRDKGIKTQLLLTEGKHNIFMDKEVIESVKKIVAAFNKT